MESPASTVRRRAWINSSRQWLTLEELDPEGPPCSLPSASLADDDVFSDGCVTGKIENWLLGCGLEGRSENSDQRSFESALKAKHFDDELSLGADASLLNSGETTSEVGFTQHPSSKQGHGRLTSTPRQALCLPSLNLGHSMASSCLSSSTCKTTSSVSDVLKLCSEDAEETLYELGFGCDEPQVTVRIPPRFFTFPSLAQGINFRLFLDSQLRRIREEDPSLSLASRFRQVQVLTAMANAFYSLYSHVSRTPLQKLEAPEFTFSSSPVERIERFRSSVRSEPRSPVERLKDTVSKMCLYTGSPRGSDSTSPQTSPKKRSSLPDVVGIVLEKTKTGVTKKLDMGGFNRSNSAVDVTLVTDGDQPCDSGKTEQTQQTVADTDPHENVNKICHNEIQGVTQTDNGDADKPEDLDSRTHSCCITVTVGDDISSSSLNAPDSSLPTSAVPSIQTCKESFNQGKSQYLNPLMHRGLGSVSNNLQQVNSFELEEVHSAGEEDFGQSETTRTTSMLSKKHQYKGEVVRGDSMQSDSSGYADEEFSLSSYAHSR
ncbi:Protein TESPA1 Thymocyte-expressed positive selection-associated protein 1 [Larimichthys crocea]|uniref:Protein TESPA1 Thymocyte-expressed positive selection-associated protein 1 n=1 Tax=Larimichthys crocea TaxID=215358 RepID=A0A6G0J432_LARCR|nr:Protein TESPA1 Thymocyte-expressed positive selection-associated protein 1 [Larimichthys crocea]